MLRASPRYIHFVWQSVVENVAVDTNQSRQTDEPLPNREANVPTWSNKRVDLECEGERRGSETER